MTRSRVVIGASVRSQLPVRKWRQLTACNERSGAPSRSRAAIRRPSAGAVGSSTAARSVRPAAHVCGSKRLLLSDAFRFATSREELAHLVASTGRRLTIHCVSHLAISREALSIGARPCEAVINSRAMRSCAASSRSSAWRTVTRSLPRIISIAPCSIEHEHGLRRLRGHAY
jgi:hypothetical protein